MTSASPDAFVGELQTGARRRRCGLMLRVTTLYAASAVATAAYYTRYLAEAPGEEPGRWLGRQADGLGVAGRVQADQLQRLLECRDPTTAVPLGAALVDRHMADGRTVRAVSGFDATFSAPKSVSVWWALSGDPGLLEPTTSLSLSRLSIWSGSARRPASGTAVAGCTRTHSG